VYTKNTSLIISVITDVVAASVVDTFSGGSRNFEGGQCISPVVIHRKCTQRVCLSYRKKATYREKNSEANRGRPPLPPRPLPTWIRHWLKGGVNAWAPSANVQLRKQTLWTNTA